MPGQRERLAAHDTCRFETAVADGESMVHYREHGLTRGDEFAVHPPTFVISHECHHGLSMLVRCLMMYHLGLWHPLIESAQPLAAGPEGIVDVYFGRSFATRPR